MNSNVLGLRLASVVFGFICLVQLLRLIINPELVVAGHQVPLWPSGVALVVLGSLSVWMWKISSAIRQ